MTDLDPAHAGTSALNSIFGRTLAFNVTVLVGLAAGGAFDLGLSAAVLQLPLLVFAAFPFVILLPVGWAILAVTLGFFVGHVRYASGHGLLLAPLLLWGYVGFNCIAALGK